MSQHAVWVRRERVQLPTYEPVAPDLNPMFLENRVYQGSKGKVYPLPFYNRISDKPVGKVWDCVFIENNWVEVMIIPALGGRIHAARDKRNGYDLFYRQSVIKPALVGLAGPWCSGGVEFNWPQHHRPATFMPVNVEIEEHADGSVTVWLGDHDPMARMKGMHGVCLHPNRPLIELKARAYNRTEQVQTFLWWANVATRVHEAYQSFFPPDVHFVADHAKRAMSRFPLCDGLYYGINYGERASTGVPVAEEPSDFVPGPCRSGGRIEGVPSYGANDLSWYANIPVPTSYMCLGSKQDFSGGYDHFKKAGLVQVSNHHISPGKKQWTWGNHAFGYAWDRNLTDSDGPYIELMLGVYTDNQPDFSFLQPGETKAWSVYWYPLREIGPARAANREAALSLQNNGALLKLGLLVTQAFSQAIITARAGDRELCKLTRDLSPDEPLLETLPGSEGLPVEDLSITVEAGGVRILSLDTVKVEAREVPEAAVEPPEPEGVASQDELYFIGLHLSQYRHATRAPEAYWREALRRDAGDARCNTALGIWHLQRGEYAEAESRLRKAVARQTSRNPNPQDGEAFYQLGLCLRHQGRDQEAYEALYKATWNQAWKAAAHHALAELDARTSSWDNALAHLDESLRHNTENLRARDLRVMVLQKRGRCDEARATLSSTLQLDPLDWWARWLDGQRLACDTQTRMDLALDLGAAGFWSETVSLLQEAQPEPGSGTQPLVAYHLAKALARCERGAEAEEALSMAATACTDYCFPARLEDMEVLQEALKRRPDDARAHYYLGNLYYDRRRHREAITHWENAAGLERSFSIVWRNLGIAYLNVLQDPARARTCYDRAFAAMPNDSRLLYERDQLWKRLGVPAAERVAVFEKWIHLVHERDDATAEHCALLNQLGRHAEARALLDNRHFQPWEGGEGVVLGQHVRTSLALGRAALASGNAEEARAAFLQALHPALNLGEARHLLANASDIHFHLGEAHAALHQNEEARTWWMRAAEFRGDFQDMSVRRYSEMSLFSALSLMRLGRTEEARQLLKNVLSYACELESQRAKVDYFATSLPTMLLFNDDAQARQTNTARFLQAQALWGLGQTEPARELLQRVLQNDPSHAGAADLLRYPTLPTH